MRVPTVEGGSNGVTSKGMAVRGGQRGLSQGIWPNGSERTPLAPFGCVLGASEEFVDEGTNRADA